MTEGLLFGKTALITGATSGVGKACALLFSAEGAFVVATGRRKDRLAELEREILSAEGRCAVLAGDIADLTLGDKLTELAQKQTGRLDILVYSAGMALRTPTLEMKPEEWDEVFRVNVTAAMFLAQKSIPLMRRQGSGRMVFISSTASKNVNLGASPSYGASKAAMDGVVRHLAAEFARDQILVNAICPGPLDTEITRTWTPEHREKVLSSLPLGRMGTPEQIARTALFLASEQSDYISGETILMNGGRYMG